ncbi:uncharacterized protein LOC142160633 [Mixophyes fleayi]|uniref:uncharacterized protein LOC142160633 n=1 Tax=Mixophyes fleayi TaxID=3061075 RepID=UPI003F4DCE65
MDKDRSHKTDGILNLTLEIIYLLTGEEYIVVKKTSDERVTLSSHLHVSERLSRTQNPAQVTVPSPHSLIHEKNNDHKILQLTNKIIQLLTGEEWEYLEGHKALYKDVMMENHQTLISCEENPIIPQDYQGDNLTDIKAEDINGEEKTLEDSAIWLDEIFAMDRSETGSRIVLKSPPTIVHTGVEIASSWFSMVSVRAPSSAMSVRSSETIALISDGIVLAVAEQLLP